MHAFYLAPEFWEKQKLEDTEFKHATQVLRLKKDASFLLFDGNGAEALCRIKDIQKKYLSFEIEERKQHKSPQKKVILAAAWTKAARRGFLLEKVVELEASELWIWNAEYSQFPLPYTNSASVQSWQAQLIAGIKQCHNPFLPKLKLFSSQKELLEHTKECEHFQVLTTDPAPIIKDYTEKDLYQDGTTLLVIGPEGGFSPKEIQAFAEHKAEFYTMGDRILRYETAAVLALGLHFWYKNTHKPQPE